MSDQLITEVKRGFENCFSGDPTGVWMAPGRVNLIGEHTDYNEGFVFPFALDRQTFAAVRLRNDSLAKVASSFSKELHEVDIHQISKNQSHDWAAYPFGVAWALQKMSDIRGRGFECFIASNVPVGAGLSSSAAIECSIGIALNDLWSAGLSKPQLARVGQLAENEIVGAPTGIMDQSASLLGQVDCGVFLDCRTLETEAVELGFNKAGLVLLIIDTKVAHRLVDGGYAARRQACEVGAAKMNVSSLRDLGTRDLERAQQILDEVTFRRVRHVVTENERVLETVRTLKSKGARAIGNLMVESHWSMRDDFEISIEELDSAVEVALTNGAIGARMTGGGFGGAAIALTPIEKVGHVREEILKAFEKSSYLTPDIFTVSAGAGARRVS